MSFISCFIAQLYKLKSFAIMQFLLRLITIFHKHSLLNRQLIKKILNGALIMKKNLISILIILSTFTTLFAEDIFIQGRSSVFNAQFWERRTSTNEDSFKSQKIMTNTTGGSFGASAEWVMWDMGKTRGSRISLFGGLDVVFLGLNYMGHTNDGMTWSKMHDIELKEGGAFYSGFKLDLYFTGTFPRTDLKWGFGFDANFMFQSYASVVKPNDDEIFYSVSSVSIRHSVKENRYCYIKTYSDVKSRYYMLPNGS